jgi:hypothetical protein
MEPANNIFFFNMFTSHDESADRKTETNPPMFLQVGLRFVTERNGFRPSCSILPNVHESYCFLIDWGDGRA